MRLLVLATLPCLLASQETLTTLKDQRALAVTIYNENLALVKDVREVGLAAGNHDLAFAEVSAMLRPETAILRNLSSGKGFWVNEQNFDFDLLTPQKLLEKAVGGKVTVVSQVPNPDGAGSRERREPAEVLACNGGVVLKFADRIETSPTGRIVFDQIPPQLRARPTLVLNLHAPAPATQRLELSYLTGGLSWHADYVMNLAADEHSMELGGLVTLTNQSGTEFPGATLQLVAGAVHRTPEPAPRRGYASAAAEVVSRAPEMKEESLFEYHLYTLDRPTTLKQNQTKQVALLNAASVPVRKEYVLAGEPWYYQGRQDPAGAQPKVAVYLAFDNRSETGLGMPLPRGVIRVYQRDREGRSQFLGEDAIDHTPAREPVRVRVGNSFDVTARRSQTDYKQLGKDRDPVEMAFRIELRNARKEPVTVTVTEPLRGDWEIIEKSQAFTKDTATSARFEIPVPAEGAATLDYRVRIRR
jgi:hypothetical protein